MNVKELKELLNTLPDDATVVVSEKFGRGGPIQGHLIGELSEDGNRVKSVSDSTIKYYEHDIDEAQRVLDAVYAGNYYWKPAETENDADVMYRRDDDSYLMQTWAGESDKWTQQKTITYWSKRKEQSKDELQKLLAKKNKLVVNAIELSCAF
jgi:hypothetical protein